jgi:hypothetical protein
MSTPFQNERIQYLKPQQSFFFIHSSATEEPWILLVAGEQVLKILIRNYFISFCSFDIHRLRGEEIKRCCEIYI